MLETFHFNGAAVRTLVQDGEPWFVAADVARVLGYSNPRAAVARHVDEEDRGTVAIRDAAYETRATIVNESGLYALIFGSRLPAARTFKRWVTSEVLPTLRRTGAYVSPDATAEQLSALAAQIEAMRGDADHTARQGENRGGVTLRALADEWGVPYPVAFEVAASFGDIKRIDANRNYKVQPIAIQSGRMVPGDALGCAPRVTRKGREAYRTRLERWHSTH